MGNRNFKIRKTKVDPDRLTAKQLKFAHILLADKDMNGARAAAEAGYKNGAVVASQLLREGHVVQKYVAKMLGDRLKEYDLSAEKILRHLETALFLDPKELFEPTEKGWYKARDLDSIPESVRRCIVKVKAKSRTLKDKDGEDAGEENWVEFELMSKDSMMALAMKYRNLVGVDQNTTNVNIVDSTLIAQLLQQSEEARKNVVDTKVIEGRLET